MNSVHDMGGLDGFGPLQREKNEPVFHADWERRMFGIAATIPFTVPFGDDDLRREIERIAPVAYLTSSYYALWLRAIGKILAEKGVFSTDQVGAGKFVATETPLSADRVEAVIAGGVETRMPDHKIAARFRIGDTVRARNIHPTGHTRLPRYARGKSGIITRDHGVFAFADSKARGDGSRSAASLYRGLHGPRFMGR